MSGLFVFLGGARRVIYGILISSADPGGRQTFLISAFNLGSDRDAGQFCDLSGRIFLSFSGSKPSLGSSFDSRLDSILNFKSHQSQPE